jgi:dUTPase
MSFHILNPIDDSVICTVERGQRYDLPASKTIYIESLTMGLIIHQIKIHILNDGPVIISRKPGIFISNGIWVDCGPVESGYINTEIFNLSNNRIRIHSGDSISCLLAL